MRDYANKFSFSMSEEHLQTCLDFMGGSMRAYQVVDDLHDYLPKVRYPRTGGTFPEPEKNPFNAWYVRTSIKGAADGKLKGKTVAVKDNIAVAGIQMMNGSSILEGYTPDVDATVVTRILDEGGEITGKSQCESYCLSGGSHTGAHGHVENPRKAGYSSAGSSSGSAALVAAGEVDLALGGDQGGSIRTPASWCGIVGMKPTFGLVPYTGAMPIEFTLDHLGPMTRNVADNALFLEVLAGPDGLDPRQQRFHRPDSYTEALAGDISSLRIGVLKEGFGLPNAERDVETSIRNAAKTFQDLGATVEEVSISMHTVSPCIWYVIGVEGATRQMMKDNGHGFNWKGLYVTSMVKAHSLWRQRPDELPDTVKYVMMLGEHMIKTGGGANYAKAQNLGRKLTEAYDAAFKKYDLLLMPTVPFKATPLPAADAPVTEIWQRAWENMGNTFAFDVTGHPSLSVPCGMSDDLPIGMQLVGRHYDEKTIYRAAHAFEQSGDWQKK